MTLPAGKPSVSVVIPAFNAECTIGFAVASVVAQSIDDWEAIAVDDGSTDRTAAVIEAISDPRVRVLRLDQNCGRGVAREFALEHCRGKFLAMVDADDWWYPWKLETQLAYFDELPEIGLLSSAMVSVDSGGDPRGIWRPNRSMESLQVFPPLRSLFDLTVPHAPSLIRMELAKAVGYGSGLRRSEDFVFLAGVLRKTAWAITREVLYVYSDVGSFRRDNARARYLWSARASLRLVREFGVGAILRSARSSIQAVLAALPRDLRPSSRSVLLPPNAAEAEAFEQARREVQSVSESLGC